METTIQIPTQITNITEYFVWQNQMYMKNKSFDVRSKKNGNYLEVSGDNNGNIVCYDFQIEKTKAFLNFESFKKNVYFQIEN